ncbi:MAG: hypothetical protein ACREDT_08245 [Methylocella sp.]
MTNGHGSYKLGLRRIVFLTSALLIVGAASSSLPVARAQPLSDPNPAVNNPDKFAWDLFAEINRPALIGSRGIADPNKEVSDPGLRVWETWKITTPIGSEVFLKGGARPAPWDEPQIAAPTGQPRKFLSPPKFTFTRLDLKGVNPHITFAAEKSSRLDFGQESRINRPGFDFIVREGLYSIDGQERFRATGRTVEFPIDTVAIKATWRKLKPDEIKSGLPSRFYTTQDPDGDIYGLTGFHMTSKALPNWFWATFEHVDNPPPEIADRDRYTQLRYPNAPSSSVDSRLRAVPGVFKNTVWQYYVLRGTQTDFTDSQGNPIILGNTQLEGGMQTSASCMSCHARATIGDRVDNIMVDNHPLYSPGTFFYPGGRVNVSGDNRLTVDPFAVFWQQDPQKPNSDTAVALAASANGAPNPNWFMNAGTGRMRYTQLDFLWEFSFAQRETAWKPPR